VTNHFLERQCSSGIRSSTGGSTRSTSATSTGPRRFWRPQASHQIAQLGDVAGPRIILELVDGAPRKTSRDLGEPRAPRAPKIFEHRTDVLRGACAKRTKRSGQWKRWPGPDQGELARGGVRAGLLHRPGAAQAPHFCRIDPDDEAPPHCGRGAVSARRRTLPR